MHSTCLYVKLKNLPTWTGLSHVVVNHLIAIWSHTIQYLPKIAGWALCPTRALCPTSLYGRAQAQIPGGVLYQIDQNIPIRSGRRLGERLLNKLDSTGVHLFGQCSHLRHISRILEHHYVGLL